jgi:hypothetical protein
MFAKINGSLLTAAFVSLVLVAAPRVQAADEFGKRATWTPPTAAEVKTQLDEWLTTRQVDEITKLKIEALWPEAGGPTDSSELLEQLGATIALVDDAARELVTYCRRERTSLDVPDFAILTDETAAPLVRSNLRLLFARWLAQNDLYDEALEQVSDVTPDEVVDPASLLFYQSVGYHRLLNKEKCLPAIAKLLEREASLPRRYSAMAHLMEADLRPLKTDSLDEISRLMDDIRRRLDLGRAGTVVRKQEDDVIAKLDKMIEEMEQQQPPPGGGGGSGSGNNPSSPKNDSTPGGASGPGNVDPKKLDRRGDWGDLPQKDRQEALQQISRELPAHYREVIEEYFRKLARDGVK